MGIEIQFLGCQAHSLVPAVGENKIQRYKIEIQNKPYSTGFPVAQTISLTYLSLLYFTFGKNSILILYKLYLLHITPPFYTTATYFLFTDYLIHNV
jgi:hypothetical protein